MKVKDIASLIERIAPRQLQESYDNAGLQIGDPDMEVTGIVTTLDVTEHTLELCHEKGANMIVSHHPLLFRGVKQINPQRDYISRVILSAASNGIAIYSAHTNLDNAPMGVNRRVGEVIGLGGIRPLARLSAEQTAGLDADFAARCGSGVVGELCQPMTATEFMQMICKKFNIDALSTNLDDFDNHPIRRVALCGGAGEDFIADAERAHADAYLTGEISYHLFFDHASTLLLAGGHFETEQYTSDLLRDIISEACPQLPVHVAPKSGPVKTFVK